jgi:ABC-type sulfate/molybdate transport systems ATPase subunit
MLDAHIVKRRRSFVIDVTLHVPARATIALFGASGSGKSTVLSCLAGFEEPDEGFVRIDGRQLFPPPLPLYLRPIGYMTQDADLFPHLTVAQNVRFGIGASDADEAWVAELRDRLGLADIWDAPAPGVSGGQARRVALARMLARRPALVLFDEPFAGLDRHIVRALIDDLTQWQYRLGFSTIVVDHRAEMLERICPTAIVLEEGREVQSGAWADLRKAPATPLLAQLLAPL